MLSVSDFYINPSSYFELLQRYKGMLRLYMISSSDTDRELNKFLILYISIAKDVCSSHPLIQYYMNYTKKSSPAELRSFLLSTVQNLMLVTEGRPRPGLCKYNYTSSKFFYIL